MSTATHDVVYRRDDLSALFQIVDDLREQFPDLGVNAVAEAVGKRYETMDLGRRGGFEPGRFESMVADDLAHAC